MFPVEGFQRMLELEGDGKRKRRWRCTSVYTPITAPRNCATKRTTRPAVKEDVEAFFGAPSERSAPCVSRQPVVLYTRPSFPSGCHAKQQRKHTHLLTRIRPSCHQNAHSQTQDSQHLH